MAFWIAWSKSTRGASGATFQEGGIEFCKNYGIHWARRKTFSEARWICPLKWSIRPRWPDRARGCAWIAARHRDRYLRHREGCEMAVNDHRSIRSRAAPGQPAWHPGPALWFLFPAAAILIVVYAGPLLFAFHASFTAWSLVDPGSDKIYVGLENYRDVLASREYWRAVTVTLSYALTAVAIELVLGTAFALMLNLDFFGRSLFRSLMIVPMVMTPAVIGVFFKLFYEQQSGIFNYFLVAIGLPRIAWLGAQMSLPN